MPPDGAIFEWFGDVIKQIYAYLESDDVVLPKHLKFIVILRFFKTPRTTLNEPPHNKTNKMTCAPSELRSACASTQSDQNLCCPHEETSDAQADLSLRWAHISFCWFCRVVAHFHNFITFVFTQFRPFNTGSDTVILQSLPRNIRCEWVNKVLTPLKCLQFLSGHKGEQCF